MLIFESYNHDLLKKNQCCFVVNERHTDTDGEYWIPILTFLNKEDAVKYMSNSDKDVFLEESILISSENPIQVYKYLYIECDSDTPKHVKTEVRTTNTYDNKPANINDIHSIGNKLVIKKVITDDFILNKKHNDLITQVCREITSEIFDGCKNKYDFRMFDCSKEFINDVFKRFEQIE